MHHGANHEDRSPATTIRDARSRSTPSTTRSTSRQPQGKDRHRRNARSNSTESRRKQGKDRHRRNSRSNSTEPRRRREKNRRRRNARSSSTESSRPRRQNRRRRHAGSSSIETSPPRGEDRRGNRGDRRRRSHDPRSRPRGRRSQSRSKRGRKLSPQRQRDASRTPKRNRRAYTTEDRLRNERERTNLLDTMYTPQRATPNCGRIAGPPRGDAERSGALRGQHTPASRWGGPRIEAPPPLTVPPRGDAGRDGALQDQHPPANRWGGPQIEALLPMTAPPRGDAGRDGALQGQRTPANLGGGPRTEASPFMTAHEAGRYGRVRVEAPKTIDQLRQLITGGMKCPVFSGSKPGELSICNSAVMLQDKIARTLSTHELGELRLPRDEQDARGFHIRPDAYTFRRREPLIGLVGDNLLTHYQLTASEPVKVVTLLGATAVLHPEHVTLTDWLRKLVGEQALIVDSTEMAREAFYAVQVRPGEEWRKVASRLVHNFRAVVADPDRPHASEAIYFWRYVAERQLYELFERVIDAVLTNPLDRLSLNSLLYDAVARVKREVRSLPIAFHDPLGLDMQKRGQVTEHVFSEFVERLALRTSAYRSVPALPQSARPNPSNAVTQLFSLDEVRHLFSSRGQLTTLEPALEPVDGRPRVAPRQRPATSTAALAPVTLRTSSSHTETSSKRPAPEVAAFTNQLVTAPGKHGVPFQKASPRTTIIGTTPSTTTRGPARLALTTEPHPQQADTPVKTAGTNEHPTGHICPPGVTAPRTEIVNYLWKTNICFRSAFGSPCPRHQAGSCPFVHDIIPAGAFATTNPVSRSYGTTHARPPRRLFAMTDEAREILAACSIAPEDSDGEADAEQNDGEGTTYDEERGEDTSVQERDA